MAAEIRENKCIVLQSRPGVDNEPTESNFGLETREFPLCNEGQILVKTLYLSVDPYMRCRMNENTGSSYLTPWQLGLPPSGGGVGIVVQSRSEKFQAGDVLESFLWPWQEFVVFSGEDSYLNKVLILALVNTTMENTFTHQCLLVNYLGIGSTSFFCFGVAVKGNTIVLLTYPISG